MYTVEQIKEAGADANIHAYYVDELIKSLDELFGLNVSQNNGIAVVRREAVKSLNIIQMNKLQKLINNLKQKKEKAEANFKSSPVGTKEEAYFFGEHWAFSFALNEVEKLLNAETQATVKEPEA